MNTRRRVTQPCELCGCPEPCGCDYEHDEQRAAAAVLLGVVLGVLLWALIAGAIYLIYLAFGAAIP